MRTLTDEIVDGHTSLICAAISGLIKFDSSI